MDTITSESNTTGAPPDAALAVDLRSLAKTMRDKFADGQRMIVRGSAIVHAVDRERWLGGELVPQPLCHTPVYGWSPDSLKPTRAPITCMKCRRTLASPDEILLPYGTFQPPLFTLPQQRRAA